jgi:hypothetical protein
VQELEQAEEGCVIVWRLVVKSYVPAVEAGGVLSGAVAPL